LQLKKQLKRVGGGRGTLSPRSHCVARYPFERALNRRARNALAKKAAAKMQQL
jgi:hypothetical protein